MEDPDLRGDETVLFRTPGVFVKSVPYTAFLTDKRIIFLDPRDEQAPQKEIALATVRDVQTGENALRDPTLTLSVITGSGEMRQMILTFSRFGGGGRARERDDWARTMQPKTGSRIRGVVAALGRGQQKDMPARPEEPGPEATGRNGGERQRKAVVPIERMQESGEPEGEPRDTDTLAYGSFCTKCGNRLPSGSAFCNRCGAKVVPPAQERGEPEPQEAQKPSADRVSVPAPVPPSARHGTKQGPAAVRRQQERDGGFLSRIFPRRARHQDGSASPTAPPSRAADAPARRRPVFTRNAVLAIVAIGVAIAVIGAGYFVYMNFFRGGVPGGGEIGNGTETPVPTPATTTRPSVTSTTTVVRTQPTTAIVPSDGVYVRVTYIGAWRGTYGIPGSLMTAARSGDFFLPVENATAMVQASIRKDDASTRPHELVVEIYRSGTLIKRGVTTEPKGQVDISVNVATASPITVATTTAPPTAVPTASPT